MFLKEKTKKFQTHSHTFTCTKKSKTITIGAKEGHGKYDGIKCGPDLINIPLCRFNFPKYPMDETRLISGMSKDLNQEEIAKRSKDLKKITKFLIRQTYSEQGIDNEGNLENFKELSFLDFIYQAGMFSDENCYHSTAQRKKTQPN
jgi:hypothetical protein